MYTGLNPFCCISELFSDKSNTHEFVDLVKELALPGELTQNRSYDFEFMQVEKPYESYTGANVRLRYMYIFFNICCWFLTNIEQTAWKVCWVVKIG